MPFRITALPTEPFQPLFTMTDDELAALGAVRVVADAKPGFPCRVSLADAEPGETLILAHHEHQPADTPFRASHALYVREGAVRARLDVGEVPVMLRTRPLSLRGFDEGGMMIAADLVTDDALIGSGAEAMLADPRVAYVHIHFAKQGCYAARLDRA